MKRLIFSILGVPFWKNRKNRKNRTFSTKKTETEFPKTETELETLIHRYPQFFQVRFELPISI